MADKAEEKVKVSPLILLKECFYSVSMLLQIILELEKLDVRMPDQHLFSLLNGRLVRLTVGALSPENQIT